MTIEELEKKHETLKEDFESCREVVGMLVDDNIRIRKQLEKLRKYIGARGVGKSAELLKWNGFPVVLTISLNNKEE